MSTAIPIGMCIGPDRVPLLAQGYDFLELGVSSALNPLLEEDAYAPTRPGLTALMPPIYAFNVFVAPQVTLPLITLEYVPLTHLSSRACCTPPTVVR